MFDLGTIASTRSNPNPRSSNSVTGSNQSPNERTHRPRWFDGLSSQFYAMKIRPIDLSCPISVRNTGLKFAVGAIATLFLQACAVIAVADAAVTVVATGVKVTAKAVGAVASAVIPGDD